MSILLFLFACGSERGVRDAPAEVTYGGWVYASPTYEERLEVGALTFALEGDGDADGVTVPAEQPFDGYLGYWQATLPPHAPFQLRVEGADAYPTVWAGDTPGANGSWIQGFLFAGDKAYIDELLASLEGALGTTPAALDAGAIHLWGVPLDGTDWDCAAVRVQGLAPACFATDADGARVLVTEGPFDWFFAFDLEPGPVRVEDGFGGGETYTATEGDLVMAFWLEHG